MKTLRTTLACQIGIAVTLTAAVQTQALTTIFNDNFNSGASPLWGNEVGSWSAAGGVYRPAFPNNNPVAYSSLPFSLTDFTLDLDINGDTDGGIWLRSTPMPGTTFGIAGVVLVMKNPNDGLGNICWQTCIDGNTFSPLLNATNAAYAPGSNPHVHIVVSGNTYEAFVNGAVTPDTTLSTSSFASGRVALYDNSNESFDNVVLQVVPEPSSLALGGLGLAALVMFRRRR